jgi:predicted phage tail protein
LTQNRCSRDNTSWRHLVNFDPKTEIGRQLSDEIKKNSYNDELGIKKTIVNFLSNYKEMINNEIINKVTLSQKIQKLYNDDAKELLMFYPSKINNYENANVNSSNSFK